jgi:predicted MFS family arabinose efflux permease
LLVPGETAGLGLTTAAAALLGLVSAAGLTLCIVAASADATAHGRDMSVAITEVSLAFTAGNAIGPALAGVVLQHLGPAAYAGLAALSCAALVWPVRRLAPPASARGAAAAADPGDFPGV